MPVTNNVFGLILAAGKGSRMNSNKPKVLHHLGGKPLLVHVLESVQKVSRANAVLVGHQADMLINTIETQWQQLSGNPHWIYQEEQLGTGHAVKVALNDLAKNKQVEKINPQDTVLILYGDVPLINATTLQQLIGLCDNHQLVLLSAKLNDPTGYGRIVRDATKSVIKIIEHRDANEEELQISEVNSGILAATFENLQRWTQQLNNDNAQKEYYLTDIVSLCVAEGGRVGAYRVPNTNEIQGVNSQAQRAELERFYQFYQAQKMAEQGLGVADIQRIDVRGNLSFGKDVFIDIGVIIEGNVTLEGNVTIGAHCILKDCHIGANSIIKPYSTIEQSQCGKNCTIGPYARLRPESILHDNVNIGNFVEIKKSEINNFSKVNHLSYIGDTKIGEKTNVGAGTITCNYDGNNKHKTDIGNNAFIGSGTELVAPLKIGDGATIGAGSTITADIPNQALTLTRAPQKIIPNWKKS